MTTEEATETKTIWKFPLPFPKDWPELDMPAGAEILYFAVQDKVPTIWARVIPSAPLERRYFRFSGTGHQLDANVAAHIGSCMQGPFVWHLFEVSS